MKDWIISKKYCSKAELEKIEDEIKQKVISAKNSAWKKYLDPIENEKKETCEILKKILTKSK